MNAHDESKATRRWGCLREFQIDSITLILPAALTDFLPHARETGSFLPQRRWLSYFAILWCARRFSYAISPGPMGHVHPACCLHTNGPVRPRQLSQPALGARGTTGKHETRQKNGIEITARGECRRVRSERRQANEENGFY